MAGSRSSGYPSGRSATVSKKRRMRFAEPTGARIDGRDGRPVYPLPFYLPLFYVTIQVLLQNIN